MLLLSDGSFNYGDIIVWLYIDEYKIDSDVMYDESRYRRVVHNRWPLSPNPIYSAAALDKVIEEIKRKQTERDSNGLYNKNNSRTISRKGVNSNLLLFSGKWLYSVESD